MTEELNLRALTPCADPLRYATLLAEPEWGVLGKRLGKAMGGVAKAVRDLSLEVRSRTAHICSPPCPGRL